MEWSSTDCVTQNGLTLDGLNLNDLTPNGVYVKVFNAELCEVCTRHPSTANRRLSYQQVGGMVGSELRWEEQSLKNDPYA